MTYTMEGYERKNIYLALENLNLRFNRRDIRIAINLWHWGHSVFRIAEVLKRDPDEVMLLIISINSKRKVFQNRDHGPTMDTNMVELTKYNLKIIARFENTIAHDDYFLFEENNKVEFVWDEEEVMEFENLWNAGIHIEDIANRFKRRTMIDVVLLIVDRARMEKISPREFGLEGLIHGNIDASSNGEKKNEIA